VITVFTTSNRDLQKLTTRDFRTGTRGFSAAEDMNVAVCVLPGTELSFEEEVACDSRWPWSKEVIGGHKTAIFRQINPDERRTHHDALEFPDGQIVLLTSLKEDQQATVLQLPRSRDCMRMTSSWQPRSTAYSLARPRRDFTGIEVECHVLPCVITVSRALSPSCAVRSDPEDVRSSIIFGLGTSSSIRGLIRSRLVRWQSNFCP